ncbi:hypothetical protein Vi05172_g5622 [Venturia inaequalis]|nr:hypothetical protein Vi05172_g5622 [Venturia inaequalis]
MEMENQLGRVTYHVLNTRTPFLLSLHDADRLGAYFNNIKNVIVRKDGTHLPVVRKWGHPFFNISATDTAFLTETELRRIHRRFGHPATERLHKLLHRAGHEDVESTILDEIKKVCKECQSYDQAPRRFKFKIKDDCYFNYEIVIDVMYLDGNQPILHVVDIATSFQAAKFLKSMSARDTWDALCDCWINVYQGPPDHVVHDPGTNFDAQEFRNQAKILGVSCEEMPVEAHHALGKVERYHGPLRRAYDIISSEIGSRTSKETILQMAVKAVNDTARPDGIVPTLLVFGAYPRINQDSPPSQEITERAEAVRTAMKELRKIFARRDVSRVINSRVGPILSHILSLPIGSKVMVWREKKG